MQDRIQPIHCLLSGLIMSGGSFSGRLKTTPVIYVHEKEITLLSGIKQSLPFYTYTKIYKLKNSYKTFTAVYFDRQIGSLIRENIFHTYFPNSRKPKELILDKDLIISFLSGRFSGGGTFKNIRKPWYSLRTHPIAMISDTDPESLRYTKKLLESLQINSKIIDKSKEEIIILGKSYPKPSELYVSESHINKFKKLIPMIDTSRYFSLNDLRVSS